MKYWQAISFCELDQLEPICKRAEALGFQGVTFGEHLVTAETATQAYDYSDDGRVLWDADTPWPDPWVQIAALARATERLEFMTTVYVLPMRDPFTAAKSISTAACIAGGRIHLGVGVGWQEMEFELVGRPYKARGRHLDEQLEILTKLWSGEMVEHRGEFYQFDRLQMSPAPPEPIPVLIGGHSAPAFRRAARHDGWAGACYPFEQLPALLEAARAERIAAAGSLDGYRMLAGCSDPSVERLRMMKELGVTDYLKPTWLKDGRAARSSLEDKLAEMERFAETYFACI